MSLYYSDDHVTLYHGDSLEMLPSLDVKANALLTDPPYFKVKQDAWDNQWGDADEFLGWMGSWLDVTKTLLAANASAWVFASPAMANSVERVVGERFRVLNSIRWLKPSGAHNRMDVTQLRSYISAWEGLIFAEQRDSGWEAADYEGHKAAFKEAGEYIARRRVRAGLSRADLGRVLHACGVYSSVESAVANVSLQEIGSRKLSPAAYQAWSRCVGLKPYADLLEDYARMNEARQARRNHYADLRRPFLVKNHKNSTDVWTFDRVPTQKGRHPCEKPLPMLEHMIETSTRPGDLILDPFAGSGSTLEAARNLRRRAVGIEQDEHWCEQIARRLSAESLDMEDVA